MMALDLLFRPSLLTPIILVVLYTVYNRIQKQKREPKGVPRADEDEQFKKAKSMPEKLLALKQNVSVLRVEVRIALTMICLRSTATKVSASSTEAGQRAHM